MIRRLPWFERTFDVDLPATIYPNLVERLRGTPARIEERTGGLSKEEVTKHVGDSWSIQENVGHLLDLEPLWLTRVEDFVEGHEELHPADLTNTKTHEANHNAASMEGLTKAFRRERGRIVEKLDAMEESMVSRTALHPRLKQPMSVMDLLFFIAEHDDHHLARISELLR